MGYVVLNDSAEVKLSNLEKKDIAQELKEAINYLKGDFYDLESGKVNYSAMKGSESFENYKQATAYLKNFDLISLKTRESKLAFWINIYNSLVVHGIIELEIKNSVREYSKFFESVSYNIGGYNFSLDEIEHGILRRNIKKHLFARRPFANSDARTQFIMSELEPRIHFSLVCGSKSCPPIGTYQEEKIDKQLDIAVGNFVNGPDVFIEKDKNRLKLSKIFKWYKADFGTDIQLIEFFAQYKKDPEEKSYLEKNKSNLSFSYLEYDWNLNH